MTHIILLRKNKCANVLFVIVGGAIFVEFAVQGSASSYAVLDSGAANQITFLLKVKNVVIVLTKQDVEAIFAVMEVSAVLQAG